MSSRQGGERIGQVEAVGGLRTGVTGLMSIVACCAVLTWAWRSLQVSTRPAFGWAKLLGVGDVDDRISAARDLGAVGWRDIGIAIPALGDALTDKSDRVRFETVLALGAAGSTAASRPSLGNDARMAMRHLVAATNDVNPDIRAEAIRGIYMVIAADPGSSSLFDPVPLTAIVTKALDDPAEKVRLVAVNGPALVQNSYAPALRGKVWPAASAQAVARVLHDDGSGAVRAAAASTLGDFYSDSEEAVRALFEAVQDDDQMVRSACANRAGAEGQDATPVGLTVPHRKPRGEEPLKHTLLRGHDAGQNRV